jgi:hypothetical protein
VEGVFEEMCLESKSSDPLEPEVDDPDFDAPSKDPNDCTMYLNNREKLYTCKYCNRTNFRWKWVDDSWRLCSLGGKLHECSKYRRDE